MGEGMSKWKFPLQPVCIMFHASGLTECHSLAPFGPSKLQINVHQMRKKKDEKEQEISKEYAE